jgi:hypothetical protein
MGKRDSSLLSNLRTDIHGLEARFVADIVPGAGVAAADREDAIATFNCAQSF